MADTIPVIDENTINHASRKELDNMADYLFELPTLTDREIYLYEKIDKRLSKMEALS